jgi:hypothetical protein
VVVGRREGGGEEEKGVGRRGKEGGRSKGVISRGRVGMCRSIREEVVGGMERGL